MKLVLRELHPNFDEYPIDDMKEAYSDSEGTFVGTEYEGNKRIISAFQLDDCIQEIEVKD